MMGIGQVMLDAKLDRIRQARDSNDGPAPPLVDRYARRKIRRGRAPIRDWTWRGLTLGSAKVKTASDDRVTIGFVNAQADGIVTIQRRRREMWSDAPSDKKAMDAAIRATLQQHRVIALVRSVA
jgi:hypothetical protein